uniref:Uncharacterized protein n=1 Tax=Siphoviridae sp. ctqBH20 TaxID=2825680 RepID=A0A8S5QDD8_9CAUD|nr:MAG TPA: hypothetical protein [Siphoviridae sp. ctqBH20]
MLKWQMKCILHLIVYIVARKLILVEITFDRGLT